MIRGNVAAKVYFYHIAISIVTMVMYRASIDMTTVALAHQIYISQVSIEHYL